MGYGGPTWDTAGTLDLGAGNTFDVADATENVPYQKHGWWTFTLTDATRVKITPSPTFASGSAVPLMYSGADYASKVLIGEDSTDGPIFIYLLGSGTYHFLMASPFGDATAYQVTYEQQAARSTPWFDTLQDDPDNILIVTEGVLLEANPNEFYRDPFTTWYADVIRRGQGRLGSYFINEVLDGAPIEGALGCAISHANHGDIGDQTWEATPVCEPLYIGEAEAESSHTTTKYTASATPAVGLIGGNAKSAIWGPSYGLWYLPVRDNLEPYGALTGDALSTALDPATYGLPADAVLEWETPTVDLVRVELADGDPLPAGDAPFGNVWALHDPVGPDWEDGWTTPWGRGVPGTPPVVDDPDRPFLTFTYEDGNDAAEDVEWHEVPNSEGWDGHNWNEDYVFVADEAPDDSDGLVIAWPVAATDDAIRDARIAVKFVLQAPRFRFVYFSDQTTVPPRRIFGRTDGATHGARRGLGGGNTVQSGNRVLGTIL